MVQRAPEVSETFDYDAELVRYNERLRTVAHVTTDDHVLDIGCGAGQTTREAAKAASSGSAFGLDLSASMIDRARRLSDEQQIHNVTFERGDAQTYAFSPKHFTLAISRFGTMFFNDPVKAFANIGTALRPGARLVQAVWQPADRQEWVEAIRQALALDRKHLPGLTAGAFSLSDPTVATDALTAAGFNAVEFTDEREPVYYGPNAASAHDALVNLGMVHYLIADLDATATAHAHDRLLTLLDAHDNGEGIWFDSAAWLISAQQP